MRQIPIPISQAKRIADEFCYDQVIIYARKVDRPAGVGETATNEIKGGEHMTTYGIDAKNCAAAAQIGDFLKFKIMGWTDEDPHEDRRYDALVQALQAAQGRIMNAKIDLQTGHTKAAGVKTLDGIIEFIDGALVMVQS